MSPGAPVFRVPLTPLAELRARPDEPASESTVRDAAYLLSQLPPGIERLVVPGVTAGQGVSLTWAKWPRVFCLQVEDDYMDAFTIENGALRHVDEHITPRVVVEHVRWALGL
jgi:hypothetical protein